MRLLLASSSALGLVLLSAWGATVFIGEVFGGQAALGPRIATFGETAIYPPWAVFDWTAVLSILANEAEGDAGQGDRQSLTQSVGDAAAQEAARVGGRIIDRQLNVRPTLRVRPGAPVRVLVTRDIQLRPYQP